MRRDTKNGFTMVELLIASFIVMLAVVITINAFMFINKNSRVVLSYLNSYLKGREAIDAISKDCRIAIRVMDTHAGYTTTDNCLVLKVPSVDASGDIIDVNKEFDYIIYWINNGDLWKQVIPGAASSRQAYNNAFKKSVESFYMAVDGTAMSSVAHKSAITHLTIWVSVAETFLGQYYRVNPGTTVKLMNYEWRFVR